MTSLTFERTAEAILCGLFLAVASAQSSAAQPLNDLSLAGVEPYTAAFDFFIEDDDGAPVMAGTWSDKVSVDNGLLSRTVTRYTTGGEVDLLRTVVVDQNSMAPVRLQQRFGPGLINVFHIEFDGQSLTQVLLGEPTRAARVSTVELDKPVVETGLQAVFTLSLPMGAPGEVTVDTYVAGAEPQTVAKTFHITGREEVEAMGRSLDTWRVEDRASQWTYWVRPDKPYIVKVVHPVPGGKMATSLVTSFK
jgi:hypothetical protein